MVLAGALVAKGHIDGAWKILLPTLYSVSATALVEVLADRNNPPPPWIAGVLEQQMQKGAVGN